MRGMLAFIVLQRMLNQSIDGRWRLRHVTTRCNSPTLPSLVGLRVRNPAAMDERSALDVFSMARIRKSLPSLTWSKAPPRPGVLQLVRARATGIYGPASELRSRPICCVDHAVSRVCSRAVTTGSCVRDY